MLPKTLLTIVSEAALEDKLIDEIMSVGAKCYTISDARGRGTHGVRSGKWSESGNIRIEVIGDAELCARIATRLNDTYEKNYALMMYTSVVEIQT